MTTQHNESEDHPSKRRCTGIEISGPGRIRPQKVDKRALAYMLDRKDCLRLGEMSSSGIHSKETKENVERILDYYAKNYSLESCLVGYHQRMEIGRQFAEPYFTLQNCPTRLRHTLAKTIYYDIDLVNAHPAILYWICQREKVACEKLKEYVCNRQACLETNHIQKTDVLMVIYGGLYKGRNGFMCQLQEELVDVREQVLTIMNEDGRYSPPNVSKSSKSESANEDDDSRDEGGEDDEYDGMDG